MTHNAGIPPTLSQNWVLTSANELFRETNGFLGFVQRLRPRICPFESLLTQFPHNARVLDVGCGSGLLLGLLAKSGLLEFGLGFDASSVAISNALKMKDSLAPVEADLLDFRNLDVAASWPTDSFNVISIVDVMHHCPSASQEAFFKTAVDNLPDGGLLIYKDMSRRPFWCGFANRMHDLVMAKQWIEYRDIGDVARWGQESGLKIVVEGSTRMFWYSHEWIVFTRA